MLWLIEILRKWGLGTLSVLIVFFISVFPVNAISINSIYEQGYRSYSCVDSKIAKEIISLTNQNFKDVETVLRFICKSESGLVAYRIWATSGTRNAAKGGIQAANGLKITGFTEHGVTRAIGSAGRMGVKPNAILDALKNPLKINNVATDQLGRQSQRFIGQFGEVVVNPQTGRIISVNPTSSSKAAKLLKQLGQ